MGEETVFETDAEFEYARRHEGIYIPFDEIDEKEVDDIMINIRKEFVMTQRYRGKIKDEDFYERVIMDKIGMARFIKEKLSKETTKEKIIYEEDDDDPPIPSTLENLELVKFEKGTILDYIKLQEEDNIDGYENVMDETMDILDMICEKLTKESETKVVKYEEGADDPPVPKINEEENLYYNDADIQEIFDEETFEILDIIVEEKIERNQNDEFFKRDKIERTYLKIEATIEAQAEILHWKMNKEERFKSFDEMIDGEVDLVLGILRKDMFKVFKKEGCIENEEMYEEMLLEKIKIARTIRKNLEKEIAEPNPVINYHEDPDDPPIPNDFSRNYVHREIYCCEEDMEEARKLISGLPSKGTLKEIITLNGIKYLDFIRKIDEENEGKKEIPNEVKKK
jgi:hypothetical protein